MNGVDRFARWVMLISGLLTLTMLRAAVSPTEALRSFFGEALEGPVAEIVVRSWGALIALVGAMLVYGAFRPAVRLLVLAVAGASKLFFVVLVLLLGRGYLGHGVGTAVVADGVMVLLFAVLLFASTRSRSAA